MAWYWPKIENESSAEAASKGAVGVSCFLAAMSGLVAILSMAYHKPILGFNGWSLVDAIVFIVIAWRIKNMSRAWAVVGLVMYLIELIFNFATNKPGTIGVLSVAFILVYISAIRGTFARQKYRTISSTQDLPSSANLT